MMAPNRRVWVPGWSEPHSQSYGESEARYPGTPGQVSTARNTVPESSKKRPAGRRPKEGYQGFLIWSGPPGETGPKPGSEAQAALGAAFGAAFSATGFFTAAFFTAFGTVGSCDAHGAATGGFFTPAFFGTGGGGDAHGTRFGLTGTYVGSCATAAGAFSFGIAGATGSSDSSDSSDSAAGSIRSASTL